MGSIEVDQYMFNINTKIADLFPGVALEDLDDGTLYSQMQRTQSVDSVSLGSSCIGEKLKSLGLEGLDLDSCDVSDSCRKKLRWSCSIMMCSRAII